MNSNNPGEVVYGHATYVAVCNVCGTEARYCEQRQDGNDYFRRLHRRATEYKHEAASNLFTARVWAAVTVLEGLIVLGVIFRFAR